MVLPKILNEQVCCPQCNGYAQILKISKEQFVLEDFSQVFVLNWESHGQFS